MKPRIANSLIFCILGVLLVSCVFPRDSPFVDDAGKAMVSPPLPEDPNMATVFFYRPPRFGLSGVSPTISIYGKSELLVGRLHNSGYTWVTMPPGKFVFKAWLPSHLAGGEKSVTLDVNGGEKYYIQVLLERYLFVLITRDVFTVTPVAVPDAEKEISALQYIRPERVTFTQ